MTTEQSASPLIPRCSVHTEGTVCQNMTTEQSAPPTGPMYFVLCRLRNFLSGTLLYKKQSIFSFQWMGRNMGPVNGQLIS